MIANAVGANLDLEKSVLQAVLLFSDQRRSPYLRSLNADCFSDARHAAVWEVIVGLYRDNQNFDLPIFGDALLRDGLDGQTWMTVGGTYVHEEILIPDLWVSPANARIHIRCLRELARERLQREIGNQLAQGTLRDPLAEALEQLQAPIWAEEEADQSGAEAVASAVIAEWDRVVAVKNSGREYAGYDCGFEVINERINGLCAGQLTVVAARPKIGKSTLALQMALSVAQGEGKTVGFISLEMTREQLGGRAACILADVDSRLQQRGLLNKVDQERFIAAVSNFAGLPFSVWLKDRDIDAIRARIRQEDQVDLWVVDHLHKIEGHGETDHERYGSSTRYLADLAVEINKPILLLCQLNRECEQRSDKRPQVGDLRASGSIEEHAVNVLLIYRPGHYEELKVRYKNDPVALAAVEVQVEIICEATRFGVSGIDRLTWVPDRGTFANIAPSYRREPQPHWQNER